MLERSIMHGSRILMNLSVQMCPQLLWQEQEDTLGLQLAFAHVAVHLTQITIMLFIWHIYNNGYTYNALWCWYMQANNQDFSKEAQFDLVGHNCNEGPAPFCRVATVQCVDISIYCLWCIIYIVRYEVESKCCSVLLLREINDFFFFEKHCVKIL